MSQPTLQSGIGGDAILATNTYLAPIVEQKRKTVVLIVLTTKY